MTRTSSNKRLLSRFHVLLQQSGNTAHKADILAGYGVESSKDLDAEQLAELCDALATQVADKKKPPEALRKARSVVLALLQDLGVTARNGNWDGVNRYLSLPQIAGKVLYDMSEQELKECAKKLRVILKKKAEGTDDQARKALLN